MPAPSKNQHVLASLRRCLRLGQKELAHFAGCSRSAIQRIELGKLPFSPGLAARIGAQTGVDLDWLMAGDYRKPPVSVVGGRLTLEFFHRHRAWKDSVRPATDEQWQWLEALQGRGFTVGLKWPEVSLPDDPKARRKHLESIEGFEPRLRLERNGKPVALPRHVKAIERRLAKRIELETRGNTTEVKAWERLEAFVRILHTVSHHKDADLLLWRLGDALKRFVRWNKLGAALPLSAQERKVYQAWIGTEPTVASLR